MKHAKLDEELAEYHKDQNIEELADHVKIEKLTPNDELEDISSKGRWGVGSCRMVVKSENDIWTALEYIQQIISA